ncbi:MAG: hypothetical protein U0V04_17145 [Spirosomataceae bacterium]
MSLFESQMAHLRSIKDSERSWLDKYMVIIFAALGFVLSDSAKNILTENVTIFLYSLFFFLTCWFQEVLMFERRSYFKVFRSIIRLEHYFNFFNLEEKVLPEYLADSGFPSGYGFNKLKNGTNSFGTFFRLLSLTFILFSCFIMAILIKTGFDSSGLCIFFIFLDIIWQVIIFFRDEKIMVKDIKSEEGLLGSNPEWYS